MKRGIELQSAAPRRGALHKLTDREVRGLGDGMHGDGGGLFLRAAGQSRLWYFRYMRKGHALYVPLGSLADRTLKEARGLAADCRKQLTAGLDPKAEREKLSTQQAASEQAAQAQAQRTASTLEAVAIAYHAAQAHRWTDKHGEQWINTLRQHVFPKLGARPVSEIKAGELLGVLQPLRVKIPETATRIRERLDAIYAHAILHELAEQNPAAAIAKALRGKRTRAHHAAMPWQGVPQFIADLRAFDRVSITTALALEFMVLTGARTAEVLGAAWAEIDERARTWTVPAARMKARQPHVVPLSDRALAILREAKAYDGENLLFPSAGKTGHPLSNMSFLALLKRMGLWGPNAERRITAHGFRASFSSWANETGAARPDVIEACLAHNEADRIRAAYNRAQFVDERRRLMQAWADFCQGKAKAAPRRRTSPRSPHLRVVAGGVRA